MSLEITEAQLLELARGTIAQEVAELRPMIRAELVEEMAFVSETEGLKILPISRGKDPLRTFRRLMNDCGVHRIKLRGEHFYKRVGENSVAAALKKMTVKPAARKASGSSKDQAPSSREASSSRLELVA